jgi:salicylate synthetase
MSFDRGISGFDSGSGSGPDPLAMVVTLAGSGLFDDYVVYERAGCWTFAGGALAVITLDAEQVHSLGPGGESSTPWSGSPTRALHSALRDIPVEDWNAYGWLGFEFAGVIPALAVPGAEVPAGELARVVIPRVEVRIEDGGIVARAVDPAEAERVRELLTELIAGERAVPEAEPTPIDVRAGGDDYRQRVAHAVKEIRAGEYQKVILSRAVPVPFTVDVAATYLLGRRGNTPARSFLVRLDGLCAAGFSPELVVAVDTDGRVTTEPLAGTRAFGRGSGPDARARMELESNPKEIFEHAVSVRTAQEELDAVCRPGTVAVGDFMRVRERGSVQHLGSTVHGVLAESRTAWDALEVLFPSVTASGIPKPDALDAILRLDGRRGLYSGAVFTASHDGSLEATLVLRAVYQQDGHSWLRAGAGIVAESTPDRELEETCEKLGSIAPFLVPAQP